MVLPQLTALLTVTDLTALSAERSRSGTVIFVRMSSCDYP